MKLEHRLDNLNKNYNYNILFAGCTLFNYVNMLQCRTLYISASQVDIAMVVRCMIVHGC